MFIFLVIKWSANFVATETRKQHLNCSFHTYFLSFVLCNCVIYFAIFCKSIIVIVSLLITTRESLHTIITIAKIGYMNPLYCFLGDSINIYKYSNVRNEILQKQTLHSRTSGSLITSRKKGRKNLETYVRVSLHQTQIKFIVNLPCIHFLL